MVMWSAKVSRCLAGAAWIVGVFRPGALSVEDIGLMMAGVKRMPKEEVERAWLY